MRIQTVMEPVPRVVLKMEVLQILENYIENSFIIFSGPATLSKTIFRFINVSGYPLVGSPFSKLLLLENYQKIMPVLEDKGEVLGKLCGGVKFY